MPPILILKRDPAHRIASIALYRALLSQCTAAPIAREIQSPLRNAIRNRFRDNRELQSPRLLEIAFRAGYEAIDFLDAAVAGDADSTKILEFLVTELPNNLVRERKPPVVIPKEDRKPHLLDCLPPGAKALEQHPRPTVSGRRGIPKLVSASGVPFLRFTKPQPRNLSRIIRQKIDGKNKRFETRVIHSNYWLPLAQQEDAWDGLLMRWVKPEEREPRWAEEHRIALKDILRKSEEKKDETIRLAKLMQNIVERETELARMEELERVEVRERKGAASKRE
ncbi:uncharacterized protein BDZ99DRAFT_460645 [Mytilinidion resinicola]|uniref:Complex 1 LYR protein domain-containing protein n=1 Tax=Mytilinidion resinicola TaxID=574789 RepID=A0A6A6YZK9_9PEZI|nr:uncharacterized protein BDZ99DRAFT_460645 [Mytilinidion resinicola]KAF2813397.1 hypothetical protein BDZ99DRAFT_460645 [Mytilinidion resinicola]